MPSLNFMSRSRLGQAENTAPQEHAPHNQGSHSPEYQTDFPSPPYAADAGLGVDASWAFLDGYFQSSSGTYEEYNQLGPLGSSPFEPATSPSTLREEFGPANEVVEDTYYKDNMYAGDSVPPIDNTNLFHFPQSPTAGNAGQGNSQLNGIQQHSEPQIPNPISIPEVSSPMDLGIASAVPYQCGKGCDKGLFPHFCFMDGNQPLIYCARGTAGALCLYSFNDKTMFDRHYWYVHCAGGANAGGFFECQVPECDRVGENGIVRRDNLRDHYRRHGVDIPKRMNFARPRPGSGRMTGAQRGTRRRVRRDRGHTQAIHRPSTSLDRQPNAD